MLTRSIDLDPFDLTIGEKFCGGAKRACVVFAISAVTLSALDLANIRAAETIADYIHNSPARVADLPNQIRAGFDYVSFASAQPSATVAIPRGDIAALPRTGSIARKGDTSLVAELAAVRHLDAVEFAMEQPSAGTKSQQRVAQPMQLASVDPDQLPAAAMMPRPVPVSLPMSSSMIPLDAVPMPRAAPGAAPPSPAQRLHLNDKAYAKAERCLANAIYFESRSEPVRGQEAVAQVVLNRVFSGFYPNDICGVVYQNASRHLACQFTFACDGKRKVINERGAWARANRIAKQTLDGQIYVPEVAKSTHYHAIYVHPNWVHEMKKVVRYGIHNFYRPYAWGNGAEEPVWGSAALASNKKK